MESPQTRASFSPEILALVVHRPKSSLLASVLAKQQQRIASASESKTVSSAAAASFSKASSFIPSSATESIAPASRVAPLITSPVTSHNLGDPSRRDYRANVLSTATSPTNTIVTNGALTQNVVPSRALNDSLTAHSTVPINVTSAENNSVSSQISPAKKVVSSLTTSVTISNPSSVLQTSIILSTTPSPITLNSSASQLFTTQTTPQSSALSSSSSSSSPITPLTQHQTSSFSQTSTNTSQTLASLRHSSLFRSFTPSTTVVESSASVIRPYNHPTRSASSKRTPASCTLEAEEVDAEEENAPLSPVRALETFQVELDSNSDETVQEEEEQPKSVSFFGTQEFAADFKFARNDSASPLSDESEASIPLSIVEDREGDKKDEARIGNQESEARIGSQEEMDILAQEPHTWSLSPEVPYATSPQPITTQVQSPFRRRAAVSAAASSRDEEQDDIENVVSDNTQRDRVSSTAPPRLSKHSMRETPKSPKESHSSSPIPQQCAPHPNGKSASNIQAAVETENNQRLHKQNKATSRAREPLREDVVFATPEDETEEIFFAEMHTISSSTFLPLSPEYGQKPKKHLSTSLHSVPASCSTSITSPSTERYPSPSLSPRRRSPSLSPRRSPSPLPHQPSPSLSLHRPSPSFSPSLPLRSPSSSRQFPSSHVSERAHHPTSRAPISSLFASASSDHSSLPSRQNIRPDSSRTSSHSEVPSDISKRSSASLRVTSANSFLAERPHSNSSNTSSISSTSKDVAPRLTNSRNKDRKRKRGTQNELLSTADEESWRNTHSRPNTNGHLFRSNHAGNVQNSNSRGENRKRPVEELASTPDTIDSFTPTPSPERPPAPRQLAAKPFSLPGRKPISDPVSVSSSLSLRSSDNRTVNNNTLVVDYASWLDF